MKTIAQCAALTLLIAGAGSTASQAQTAPAGPRPTPHRYSGKLFAVDPKGMSITLQADKSVITIADTTKLVKVGKPAKFDDLAVGQTVTGVDHKDTAGNWVADSVNVGAVRQIPDAPAPKAFVAPPRTNAPPKTNAPVTRPG